MLPRAAAIQLRLTGSYSEEPEADGYLADCTGNVSRSVIRVSPYEEKHGAFTYYIWELHQVLERRKKPANPFRAMKFCAYRAHCHPRYPLSSGFIGFHSSAIPIGCCPQPRLNSLPSEQRKLFIGYRCIWHKMANILIARR